MKKIIALLALFVSANALAGAGLPQPAVIKALLNNGGAEASRKVQIGTQMVNKKVQLMRAVYNFAVDGGAVSTINLKDEDGKDAILPDNALIKQVIVRTVTGVTSGGAATVSVGANSTTDLVNAAAKTAVDVADELLAGSPVGTAGTAVVTTAQRTLTITIGAQPLTAGKLEVFVEYYIGS